MSTVAVFPLFLAGCDAFAPPQQAPLFSVPLQVEGREVSKAVLDTGGGYELLLREDFGIPILGEAEILAFGGKEVVELTSGFRYTAGGIDRVAEFALVGVSACDCNGLGYHFFQKADVVLALDFLSQSAWFIPRAPSGGVTIPFVDPPPELAEFRTSFIRVEVGSGFEPSPSGGVPVRALLDTGSNITAMRRGFLEQLTGSKAQSAEGKSAEVLFVSDFDRAPVTVAHPELGTLGISVILFDTAGLPDLILGTDAMGVWGDAWYFSFAQQGQGSVTVKGLTQLPSATNQPTAR